jgi:hypothetical protein
VEQLTSDPKLEGSDPVAGVTSGLYYKHIVILTLIHSMTIVLGA